MALLTKSQIKTIIVDGLEQIAPIQNDVGVDAIAEAIFQAQNSVDGELPENLVESFNGRTGDVVAQSGDYSTSLIPEDPANLYYTDTRFDTRLSTKTTDDLTEGSNLYWKEAPQDSTEYVRKDGGWVQHTALGQSYDNTASGLTATTTQAAIDETDNRIDNLNADQVFFDDTGLPSEITALGFTTVKEVLDYLLSESVNYLELNT